MNATVTTATVPPASQIAALLDGAHFYDCYTTQAGQDPRTALALYLDVVRRAPGWVNRMMALRNRIVSRLGLKDLGHLGTLDTRKPAHAYRVCDRVGIFSLKYLSDQEIILGDSDKHLDVQVSIHKTASGTVSVSTVVHIHNLLGRVYMLAVGPLHKLIVPAVLRRLDHPAQSSKRKP